MDTTVKNMKLSCDIYTYIYIPLQLYFNVTGHVDILLVVALLEH